MSPEDVGYESVSIKTVLTEMKDTAELLIGLSYSAALHANDDLAVGVLDLEERIDILQPQTRMSLMMAVCSPEDAEELAPVLGVIGAAEKISDTAGDITKVVIEDIGLPDATRVALPEAVETTIRCGLTDESPYAGRNPGDINMETETDVRVVAIHRAGEWVTNPDHETTLRAGDALLLRGHDDDLHTVHGAAANLRYDPPDVPKPTVEDPERAVDSIILMKDMSELAVDLAYDAVLFDNEGAAEEVEELEAGVGALKSRFEAWMLHAVSRVEGPVSLHGLVQLAGATGVISDVALEITESILRDIDAHPVIAAAIKESGEAAIRLRVAPASDLAKATLGDRRVKSETGMHVIAVRRTGGREWIVSPGSETWLHGNNLIITKSTRADAERLDELVDGEYKFDE